MCIRDRYVCILFRMLVTDSVIFSTSYDKTAKVWNLDAEHLEKDEDACIMTLEGHTKGVYPLIFNPGIEETSYTVAYWISSTRDLLINFRFDVSSRGCSFRGGWHPHHWIRRQNSQVMESGHRGVCQCKHFPINSLQQYSERNAASIIQKLLGFCPHVKELKHYFTCFPRSTVITTVPLPQCTLTLMGKSFTPQERIAPSRCGTLRTEHSSG